MIGDMKSEDERLAFALNLAWEEISKDTKANDGVDETETVNND
jgi:hypothetical protein